MECLDWRSGSVGTIWFCDGGLLGSTSWVCVVWPKFEPVRYCMSSSSGMTSGCASTGRLASIVLVSPSGIYCAPDADIVLSWSILIVFSAGATRVFSMLPPAVELSWAGSPGMGAFEDWRVWMSFAGASAGSPSCFEDFYIYIWLPLFLLSLASLCCWEACSISDLRLAWTLLREFFSRLGSCGSPFCWLLAECLLRLGPSDGCC